MLTKFVETEDFISYWFYFRFSPLVFRIGITGRRCFTAKARVPHPPAFSVRQVSVRLLSVFNWYLCITPHSALILLGGVTIVGVGSLFELPVVAVVKYLGHY